MSSIYGLQTRAAQIEQRAKDAQRDLPVGEHQNIRTDLEVIEALARHLQDGAESLRSNLRPLVDG